MHNRTQISRLPYQRYEDQDENGSCANQKSSAEQSSKTIDNILQRVSGHNDHSQHDTGHVDSSPYVLGIIKTFDLDLTDREGKKEGDNLEYHLVAIQDTEKDCSSSGVTNKDEIINNDFKILWKETGANCQWN